MMAAASCCDGASIRGGCHPDPSAGLRRAGWCAVHRWWSTPDRPSTLAEVPGKSGLSSGQMGFSPTRPALRSALRLINPSKYTKMPYPKLMDNPPLVGKFARP